MGEEAEHQVPQCEECLRFTDPRQCISFWRPLGRNCTKNKIHMLYSNPGVGKRLVYSIGSDKETVLDGEGGHESDGEIIRMISGRDELATRT